MKKILFFCFIISFLIVTVPPLADSEDNESSRISPKINADFLRSPDWGNAVDGLRSRVLVPQGNKVIGEDLPIVVSILNEGTSSNPDGRAVLGPMLRLDVSRNNWQKTVFVPANCGYFHLEKGKEFHYGLDISHALDMDVAGTYLIIGGYDSSAVKKLGNTWSGPRITSHPSHIALIKKESHTTTSSKAKELDRKYVRRETEWGEESNGLRCKISADTGSYLAGEPIQLTITIKNSGTPDSPHGDAQLFPFINLWMQRAGWEKEVKVSLDIRNRLHIKKDDSYSFTTDLSKVADLTVPGEYTISGGHNNYIILDIGDWTGTVKSPLLEGIIIVE